MAKRYVASLLGLALLGGCSGGGSVPSATSNTPKTITPAAGTTAAQRNATATFTVRIPAAAQLKNFKAKFISSNTASILVYDTVAGTALPSVFANVTGPGSTIKVIVPAKAGDNTFTIQLKDGPDGTGNTLATKTLTVNLVADTDNAIPVVLSGVIASLSWDASPPQALLVGTAASFSPVLQGKDASGELIIGPYDSPVTLTPPTPAYAAGTVLGNFTAGQTPWGVAIDGNGNAWVANYGSNDVTKLSSDGANLGTFSVGSGPHAIAIDGSGNVWVSNSNGASVTKLSSIGTTLGTFPTGVYPVSIAFDSSGNAWVANGANDSVTELSSDGTTLGTFDVTGPTSIAFDSSGNAWAGSCDGNLAKLSSTGAPLGNFQVANGGLGTCPWGLAIDSSDNKWTANYNGNTVSKLGPDGTDLGTFSVGNDPSGIGVDSNGNVWVGKHGDNNVTELSPDGAILGTFASMQEVTVVSRDPSVGDGPRGLAIDRNRSFVWVTGSSVTKLSSGTTNTSGLTLSTTSLPDSTTALTVSYDGAGNGKGQVCATVTGVGGSACISPTGSNTTANLEVTGKRASK